MCEADKMCRAAERLQMEEAMAGGQLRTSVVGPATHCVEVLAAGQLLTG